MRSPMPKFLSMVGHRCLIDWAIDTCERAGARKILVVVNDSTSLLASHVVNRLGPECLSVRDHSMSASYAPVSAAHNLRDHRGAILVFDADLPLVRTRSIQELTTFDGDGDKVGVLCFEATDPATNSRAALDRNGNICRLIEFRNASQIEMSLTLCAAGAYAFSSGALMFRFCKEVQNNHQIGGSFLSEAVNLANENGIGVIPHRVDDDEILKVTSQYDLAMAEESFQHKKRNQALAAGATLLDPRTTFFAWDTELASGTRVPPMTTFLPRGTSGPLNSDVGVQSPDPRPARVRPRVFLVHGRDHYAREAVARFLERIGFEAIILDERAGRGQALLDMLIAEARECQFAVVIATPDDLGHLTGEEPRPRARQNVIFELGFLIGLFGPARVCTLLANNVQKPSDYDGIRYVPFNSSSDWKLLLLKELDSAGLKPDKNGL